MTGQLPLSTVVFILKNLFNNKCKLLNVVNQADGGGNIFITFKLIIPFTSVDLNKIRAIYSTSELVAAACNIPMPYNLHHTVNSCLTKDRVSIECSLNCTESEMERIATTIKEAIFYRQFEAELEQKNND